LSGCRRREGRTRRGRGSTRNKTMQRPFPQNAGNTTEQRLQKLLNTPLGVESLPHRCSKSTRRGISRGSPRGGRKHLVDLLTSQDSSTNSYFFAICNRNAVRLVNSFFPPNRHPNAATTLNQNTIVYQRSGLKHPPRQSVIGNSSDIYICIRKLSMYTHFHMPNQENSV
jgi:hypothetical protein